MKNLIADAFGSVVPPTAISKFATNPGVGLGTLLNVVLKILLVVAGIYTLINLLLAGYDFLGAGDDSKKVAGAWAKIWQSLLGLAVAAGAFVLAAIFGLIIFGKADAILNPSIPNL